ncbi:MAG: hypothetical protein KAI47_15905 [Deltaproteobacteria bacterium]|nr:hypothetical protein [Deltaproteobacteria bacterium]
MTTKIPFALALTLALTFVLSSAHPAQADSVYKRSRWATKLVKGKLLAQGPGYGAWGKRWVTVDTQVIAYREVGTSKGPVLVYVKGKKSKHWYAVQLMWSTGARQNKRGFSKPTVILRGGRFGALLRVGKQCYDYAWNHLRQIDCKTRRFK